MGPVGVVGRILGWVEVNVTVVGGLSPARALEAGQAVQALYKKHKLRLLRLGRSPSLQLGIFAL